MPINLLRDETLVLRGGSNDARLITLSTFAIEEGLRGVAAFSANGLSLEDLSRHVRHQFLGVSTVGSIREAGGDRTVLRGQPVLRNDSRPSRVRGAAAT